MTDVRVGTSGRRHRPWRGALYPPGLVRRRELEHLSCPVSGIEINGRPASEARMVPGIDTVSGPTMAHAVGGALGLV